MATPLSSNNLFGSRAWGYARTMGSSSARMVYSAAIPVLRPVGNLAWGATSKLLTPVKNVVLSMGQRAIVRPMQNMADRAGLAVTTPLATTSQAITTTGNAINRFAEGTSAQFGRLVSDALPCAQAYGTLAQTLKETIVNGSYLATSVTGLYVYNMASNGIGAKTLFGKIQKGVGLTIAVVAGAYWLGRVASNIALPPK